MAMHKEFPDWYRVAAIAQDSEVLTKRWAGVEALAGTLKQETLLALIRMYSIDGAADTLQCDPFDQAFRKHDANFAMRGNSLERRVLAGATLRHAMERGVAGSSAAALGVISATFGHSEHLVTPGHLDFAKEFVAARSKSIRVIKPIPAMLPITISKDRYAELLPQALFAQNQLPQLHEPLFSALTEIINDVNAAHKNLSQANQILLNQNEIQREELNLLWWAQSDVSRDLNEPFSRITVGAASIIFSTELAELTILSPGPSAIFGLLLNALSKCIQQKPKETTPARAIAACPRKWRESTMQQIDLSQIGELCPVLLGMKKSLETDGDVDWLPVYRKASHINIEDVVSPIEIGMQLYNERMFLRSIKEVKR